jgi:hypothetical protein
MRAAMVKNILVRASAGPAASKSSRHLQWGDRLWKLSKAGRADTHLAITRGNDTVVKLALLVIISS